MTLPHAIRPTDQQLTALGHARRMAPQEAHATATKTHTQNDPARTQAALRNGVTAAQGT